METSKVKIHRAAVVGCGGLAQAVHLPNVRNNPRLCLAVACDLNACVAKTCRDRVGAERAERAESDWRKIIAAPDVDLIVLATYANLRGELIIPALRAGKPVYTEKPLSADPREMIKIIRAARETQVPVCIGHNRRFSPAVLELKRLRDECLNQELLLNLREARAVIEDFRRDYNKDRPPSKLGYLSPNQWIENQSSNLDSIRPAGLAASRFESSENIN